MTNYHENGQYPSLTGRLNPVGGLHEPAIPGSVSNGQSLSTETGTYTGLTGDYEITEPVEQNYPGANSAQSSIINGNHMSDLQGEMPVQVTPDVLINTDTDKLQHLSGDFAAISETGGTKEMNKAHGVFVESVYSPQFIPVLDSLLKATDGNPEAQAEVRAAIDAVDSSLMDIRTLSKTQNQSLYQSFLDIDNLSDLGDHSFRTTIRAAQNAAKTCIEKYGNSIADPQAIHQASEVYGRLVEREIGIEMPKGFMERLMDPNTRALMLELDFNSTLNVKEAHAIPGLVKQTQHSIRRAVESFKRAFPDKKIVINLNTGRPDQYIWGVHEAMMGGIPEARQFALAESGGVIVTNLESGATEIAVENPEQWKTELQGIRDYITHQLANPKDLMIERKQSMLSIRVAEPNSSDFILKTKDGHPAGPDWISKQIEEYFLKTQSELGTELETITEDLKQRYPEAEEYIQSHLNGNGNGTDGSEHQSDTQQPDETNPNGVKRNNGKVQVLKTLRDVFNIAEADLEQRLNDIDSRLDTIDTMFIQGLLQSKYNPTAGYVDIAHTHLNKYSSSVKYLCKQLGITPDQITWAIIGDSSTDIIPEELTGQGEPNEEADKAYMFAVKEHNAKMAAALQRRGDTGISLMDESTLAVVAVMKGLEKACKGTIPPKQTGIPVVNQ